ncbi:MAG: ABC transporter ATP-binding protein [Firmicutes bacterium]|nr:ABC transporter ATP-binding protein/permease [Bacillota bacterium]MDD6964440.1 ABC transporter ATP-binding protein [Bacillota bacterium]
MKKLLIYLKEYRKEACLAPIFKMLEAVFELFVPLVIKGIIDYGIAAEDRAYCLRMGLLLLLLAVIGLAMATTAQWFSARAAAGFAAKIKQVLMEHIQKLSYTELDTIGTSTLITRMTSDVNQVQTGTNLVLRLFMRSPFIVFGSMIMAFTIDFKAAMIFVITIPLLSVVVFGIMLSSIPLYKKVQSQLDRVLGITRENLTGVRVIRAFNKEEEEISHFKTENEQFTRLQTFVGKISALMNPLTFVIVNSAILVLVWTGAWRVEGGILTQGAVVALVNYMSQILVELIKLADLIINITKAVACGNRIQKVLEVEPSMENGSKECIEEKRTPANSVDFNHVSLTYSGAGAPSLTDIDLHVKTGQTIGIIGGTGSGKTSVVNLIPRFYDATQGNVLVFGKPVKEQDMESLRSQIAVVPQKAVLFAGTIRENMKWGKEDATDEEIMEALTIAQAAEVVQKKEGGLDAFVEQGGKNLSGGQRQRLTIARALVRKPRILILDDSASALDFATDAALRKAIREMKNAPTVFIVSQRTSSIRFADQILVLDDGKSVGVGTHDELLTTCSVYKEIYDSQYKKTDSKKSGKEA